MIFVIKGFRTIAFIFIVISLEAERTSTFNRYAMCPLCPKETIIWRLQVQSWLQASNTIGIFNTCDRLWLTNQNRWPPRIQ